MNKRSRSSDKRWFTAGRVINRRVYVKTAGGNYVDIALLLAEGGAR